MLVDNGSHRIFGAKWPSYQSYAAEKSTWQSAEGHKTSIYRTHRYTVDGARNEESMIRWAWKRCYKRDCTAGR